MNPTLDINEVFPYKVCINLDRRSERWEQMRSKFERSGIRDVRRFAAVDGQQAIVPHDWQDSPGAYGCLRSHLDVITDARRLGMPSVLIFEDDAAFNANLWDDFANFFPQVPSDWDMLFFGANHMAAPVPVSKNVVRIKSANSTFTYALNHTVFDSFIELNTKALTAVDLNNRTLQTMHACYCFRPHLAWVEDVSSDVQVRQKYHWYLKESLVLHGSEMDRILEQTLVILAYQGNRENLDFLLRFYREHLAGVSVVVMESFEAGMKLAADKHSFVIFSDSNIFVEAWDIRGNLRMCETFDAATGFRSVVELTKEATQLLRTSKPMLLTPWFDANDYSRREKEEPFEGFYIFNRRAIGNSNLNIFQSPNDALKMFATDFHG